MATATATLGNDSNVKTSLQKLRLHSGLVTSSLYIKSTMTGLHLLRDSIVWDSRAACHICNNLDRAITLLQLLNKEIFISTAYGDELIVGIANIAINYQIDR